MHKFKEPKDRENLNEKVSMLNVARNTEHRKKNNATEFSNKQSNFQDSSEHTSQALKN